MSQTDNADNGIVQEDVPLKPRPLGESAITMLFKLSDRMDDIVVELTDVIDTVENSLLASSPSAWERTDWEVLDDVAKHIGELRNHMAAILYYWTPEATANLADGQKAFFSLWERNDKIRHDRWQRAHPMPKTHAVTPPNVPDYGQSKASMWAITGPPTRRPAEQAEADEKDSSPGANEQ